MKNFIVSLVVILSAIFSLSSCLGDSTEYTYYDDCAITGFSLGTLNRYYHKTKSDGTDSVYKRTLSCSSYTFYIDQEKREIWNKDSLPYGIDASKVICTISTKNNSVAYIKSMSSDSLKTYSSSDSIDFSTPRQVFVYNTNSNGYNVYTVRVNVHQEKGDTCTWSMVASSNAAIGKLKAMKAVANNGKVYVFGNDGTESKLYTTDENDGVNWFEITTAPALDVDAYKNVLVKDGSFYVLSNGQILKSSDAINWTAIANSDIRQLVAASSFRLYALSANGTLVSSSDEGASWTEEELDDATTLLPYNNISFVTSPLSTNANADKVLLYGSRDENEYASDSTAVVWTKVDEYADGSRNHKWNYIEYTRENNHKAPRLTNMQLVNYDNEIIAIGGKPIGACKKSAFNCIYRSGDGGITWRNDSVMYMPDGVNSDTEVFGFVVDSSNSVWIICGGTGRTFKGRINRLAWKKEQEYFTEAKKRNLYIE